MSRWCRMGVCVAMMAAALLAGCDEEAELLCVPGETRTCVCGGGRDGAQWCNADGDAWACCHCDGLDDDDDDTIPTDDDDTTPPDDGDDDATDDDEDDDSWPKMPSPLRVF